MCKLSIIIPVYNVEKYLPACLESVDRAAQGRCEILLIDDGSTDSSGALCEDFAHGRDDVKVIHQENAGLGGARNTGIEAAGGEYLFFVDSDDTVTEDSVDTVLENISLYNPDMLCFSLRCINESGKVLYEAGPDFPAGKIFDPNEDRFILTQSPNAWNKVFRASLFKESGIRFPPRLWYEDLHTIPKLLALCHSVVYCPKILYNYLSRTGSIMNSSKVDRNIEIVEAMEDLRSWFSENGLFEKYADELEYLTVSHVLLDACIRVIRQAGSSHPLVRKLRSYALEKCPDPDKNKYCRKISGNRKIVYRLLKSGMVRTVGLVFKIKK
ncbi:MAG: glycosyltransferase family 2 protein [Candidatus Avispirillum sp.]